MSSISMCQLSVRKLREVKDGLGSLTRWENEFKFYVSAKYQKVERS